jgi:hypothetical protein
MCLDAARSVSRADESPLFVLAGETLTNGYVNQRLLVFRYGACVSLERRNFSENRPTDV